MQEPGQVSRVAEEARLCSCWSIGRESVAIHELAHCRDGGTRSCLSPTDVFFSSYFLEVSALRDNTSDSLFGPDVKIYDAQHPRCQETRQHELHFRFHIVSINPCFIAGYNSFKEVFILDSVIQKFLADDNATVSLICQKSWGKL
jgi:hypothetical protein